jgi:hypothetical protein
LLDIVGSASASGSCCGNSGDVFSSGSIIIITRGSSIPGDPTPGDPTPDCGGMSLMFLFCLLKNSFCKKNTNYFAY